MSIFIFFIKKTLYFISKVKLNETNKTNSLKDVMIIYIKNKCIHEIIILLRY